MISPPTSLPTRAIGRSGLTVSALGLGCMSFSGIYGDSDDDAAIALIHEAIERGVTLLDSADMYGWGHNEELLARALAGKRNRVVLATKFGQTRTATGGNGVDGRPDYVVAACEASLTRLKTDVIDLYYQHRVDPSVPIEDTVGAMARLVTQGKVRAIGLCEARPETIRRAHAIHPLAAVQTEYSLLYRSEAEETRRTTRELGISFVAYSPLGRGVLTGYVPTELAQNDRRRAHPRFLGDNLAHNLALAARVRSIADRKSCTPAQLVLAWLLAQGDDVIAIPGTKHRDRFAENMGALDVRLTAEDLAQITAAVPADAAAGLRYPTAQMEGVYL